MFVLNHSRSCQKSNPCRCESNKRSDRARTKRPIIDTSVHKLCMQLCPSTDLNRLPENQGSIRETLRQQVSTSTRKTTKADRTVHSKWFATDTERSIENMRSRTIEKAERHFSNNWTLRHPFTQTMRSAPISHALHAATASDEMASPSVSKFHVEVVYEIISCM